MVANTKERETGNAALWCLFPCPKNVYSKFPVSDPVPRQHTTLHFLFDQRPRTPPLLRGSPPGNKGRPFLGGIFLDHGRVRGTPPTVPLDNPFGPGYHLPATAHRLSELVEPVQERRRKKMGRKKTRNHTYEDGQGKIGNDWTAQEKHRECC